MAVQVIDRENKKSVFPADGWDVDSEGYLTLYKRDKRGEAAAALIFDDPVATFNKVAWQSVGTTPDYMPVSPEGCITISSDDAFLTFIKQAAYEAKEGGRRVLYIAERVSDAQHALRTMKDYMPKARIRNNTADMSITLGDLPGRVDFTTLEGIRGRDADSVFLGAGISYEDAELVYECVATTRAGRGFNTFRLRSSCR